MDAGVATLEDNSLVVPQTRWSLFCILEMSSILFFYLMQERQKYPVFYNTWPQYLQVNKGSDKVHFN